ncbi:FtsB family cell division protein [Thermoflexibacter ruber]|uniref:Cell division protein FtsB n=1 Tax=Thermoflexibacter ruber TaxID=1003 RepID=A0A1I2FDK4_9BACT|nr:septum formation initiator family protein [Thermoflexibacter ruber]SFF02827.1 Cell division protein FtsB [Thermoflexibacter ruber]
MISKLKQLFNRFNNFYLLFLTVFAVWMLFFDGNNIYEQIQTQKKISQLEQDKMYYKESILSLQKEIKELQANPKQLEKFAREKYKMKKPKEDVYVIVEK